jgi:uncharacterized protein (DUF1697 family)
MGQLREVLAERGHKDVRTLLQSGNIVLSSGLAAHRLEVRLEQELADALEMEIRVLVRTKAELADIVARNPLGEIANDPKRYSVSFLSTSPDAAVARELAEIDVAPERLVLSGREIYLWQPGGIQRSALARVLDDKRLGATSTTRNWSTVTKLLALAAA